MKRIIKICNNSFFKFAIIGMFNTFIGTFVMFFCYRFLCLGYWISSAMNYIVGSIFSFFANKHFTFQSKNKSIIEMAKFVLNILVCYLIAYGCAKPFVRTVVSHFWQLDQSSIDEIAMVTGMIFFVCVNYLGQRFYVFRRH